MIRQTVPYGNNAVSKIIFSYVVMTVMLNKFKFITSLVLIKLSVNSIYSKCGTHAGSYIP